MFAGAFTWTCLVTSRAGLCEHRRICIAGIVQAPAAKYAAMIPAATNEVRSVSLDLKSFVRIPCDVDSR